MLCTEEEAREKWCPQRRTVHTNGRAMTSNNTESKCITSKCMMWNWMIKMKKLGTDKEVLGYCGLAGFPLKEG